MYEKKMQFKKNLLAYFCLSERRLKKSPQKTKKHANKK